jgi:hypothetical protein
MNEELNNNSENENSEKQFWDLYIGEHQKPLNRWMHATGTLLAGILIVVTVVTRQWWLLFFVPVIGYGFAWTGHALVEKNRPLSFKFPIRSLFADFKLAFLMWTGQNPK